MKVCPSYFQSASTFALLLILVSTLQSCGSYQYYAENSDGIYSSNPAIRNKESYHNNGRIFSNGIANLDLNRTLEDEMYFDNAENNQEHAIQEGRNGNVSINIGAGYNYWDPFWNPYQDPYWSWNFGYARPFGFNNPWNGPYYNNFLLGNYWGWNNGFIAPRYQRQRWLFTPNPRYYGKRNNRRIAYTNQNKAYSNSNRRSNNRIATFGRRAASNTSSSYNNKRTTNDQNTTYRRSSSSTNNNASNRQKRSENSKAYRSSSNSNYKSSSYAPSRRSSSNSSMRRSSSSGRSAASSRRR